MKVQLIDPPLPDSFLGASKLGFFPPFTLLSLASYLNVKLGNLIELEILDGQLLSMEEILTKIDADIVGLTSTIINYENALIIAEKAKSKGSLVIIGGTHASSVYSNIIKNRSYIDAVVVNEGETSLLEIINGKSFYEINNLVYKNKSEIHLNNICYNVLDELPFINYNLTDLSKYQSNYRSFYNDGHFNSPAMVLFQKGCSWQQKGMGCSFCRRVPKLRLKSPQRIWDEIGYYEKNYNFDYLWEVSDSLTSNKTWLKKLVKEKPNDIKTKLLTYGRVDELDLETIRLLKELNCYKLFVGFESYDQNILDNINKGVNVNEYIRVVDILKSNNIEIMPSFVLGLPGENIRSIEKTIHFINLLKNNFGIKEIACSIVVPIPQSPLFNDMMKISELYDKYKNIDLFAIDELQADYITAFCEVELSELIKCQHEIKIGSKIPSGFGVKNDYFMRKNTNEYMNVSSDNI